MKIKIMYSLFLIYAISHLSNPLLYAQETILLTLQDAISIALGNNLNLEIKKADLFAAKGNRLAQNGNFDTMISAIAYKENNQITSLVQGGASEEDLQVWNTSVSKKIHTGTEFVLSYENQRYDSNALLVNFNPLYQSALSLGIKQPLFKGAGIETQTADIRIAEKNITAASRQIDTSMINLVADTKKAYWELHFYSHEIAVKNLSLKLAQKIVEDTKHKIEAGVVAAVEIYRPESEYARREEQLINTERTRADAEDKLKLLLNRVEWDATIETEKLPVSRKEIPEINKVIAVVLNDHPDLKTLKLKSEAALLQVEKTKNFLLPDISLFGRTGVSGTDEQYGDSMDNMMNNSEYSWQIGVNFSMPLTNDLANGNKVLSMAQYNKTKLNNQILKQQFIMKAKVIVRNFKLSLKSIDASDKTVLAAQKNLEAEQEKFSTGLSTSLDILLAQESYTQALATNKRAQVNHEILQAELDRTKGSITVQ